MPPTESQPRGRFVGPTDFLASTSIANLWHRLADTTDWLFTDKVTSWAGTPSDCRWRYLWQLLECHDRRGSFPLQSVLLHTIPALLVQLSDILHNLATCDAVMSNIHIVPLGWWAPGEKAKGRKVMMCVKLQHVQQLVGQCTATMMKISSQGMLWPSKRIVHGAHEVLVCFFWMRWTLFYS